jgi:hypothetical protein
MNIKIKSAARFAAFLLSFFLAGCGSPKVQRVDLGTVGNDVVAVGNDLTNKTVNNASLGKDLQSLSGHIPALGADLTSLGQPVNRFGRVPTPIEKSLATFGQELSSTNPSHNPSAELSVLGADLSNSSTPTNKLSYDKKALANDLQAHLGPALQDLGADLLDPVKSAGFKDDVRGVAVPRTDFAQHISSLGVHLSAQPTGDDATGNLDSSTDDLVQLGKDFQEPSGAQSLLYTFFFSTESSFQSTSAISYNTSNNTARLTNSGSSTALLLKASYYDRFVLRPNKGMIYRQAYDDSEWHFVNKWADAQHWYNAFVRPDIEWHLGFLLGNGSNPTNIPASTIAGGGDFYTDSTVGIPLARRVRPHVLEQITFDVSGGVSTDKEFMAVHPNVRFGLGYQAAFTAPSLLGASTNPPAFIISRAGYGFVDMPYLSSPNKNLDIMVTDLPQFDMKGAPEIESSIDYPLGNGSYLTLGVAAWILKNPTPWNISTGLTFQFDAIARIFGVGK